MKYGWSYLTQFLRSIYRQLITHYVKTKRKKFFLTSATRISYSHFIFSIWLPLLSLLMESIFFLPFPRNASTAQETFILFGTHLHWILSTSPLNEAIIYGAFYCMSSLGSILSILKLPCRKSVSSFSSQSPLIKWSHSFFWKNYWWYFKHLSFIYHIESVTMSDL